MILQVTDKSGKVYQIQAAQVAVFTDRGHPVAVSYTAAGFLVHTDRTHDDFVEACAELGIHKLPSTDE